MQARSDCIAGYKSLTQSRKARKGFKTGIVFLGDFATLREIYLI
jgi:hypothetical protein